MTSPPSSFFIPFDDGGGCGGGGGGGGGGAGGGGARRSPRPPLPSSSPSSLLRLLFKTAQLYPSLSRLSNIAQLYLARIVRSGGMMGFSFLFLGGFAAAAENDAVSFPSPSRSDDDENDDGYEDARYSSRKAELSSAAAVEVFFTIMDLVFIHTAKRNTKAGR